jgi:hypothetical protein
MFLLETWAFFAPVHRPREGMKPSRCQWPEHLEAACRPQPSIGRPELQKVEWLHGRSLTLFPPDGSKALCPAPSSTAGLNTGSLFHAFQNSDHLCQRAPQSCAGSHVQWIAGVVSQRGQFTDFNIQQLNQLLDAELAVNQLGTFFTAIGQHHQINLFPAVEGGESSAKLDWAALSTDLQESPNG